MYHHIALLALGTLHCLCMGVGRGAEGAKPPLGFENYSKKGCFLSFEREEPNFTTFGPPLEKFWKNPLMAPPGKNPSDGHVFVCLHDCAIAYKTSCATKQTFAQCVIFLEGTLIATFLLEDP